MTMVCSICNSIAPLVYSSFYQSHQFLCLNCGACQAQMIQILIEQNQRAFIYWGGHEN